MEKLIEWRKLQASNGDSYYGYFRGLQIAYIMDVGLIDEYSLGFSDDSETTHHKTIGLAKEKAEELLKAWLVKAKLISEPVRCSKCRNSGSIRHKHMDKCRYMKNIKNKCNCGAHDLCPCTKDPNSLYNLINNNRG